MKVSNIYIQIINIQIPEILRHLWESEKFFVVLNGLPRVQSTETRIWSERDIEYRDIEISWTKGKEAIFRVSWFTFLVVGLSLFFGFRVKKLSIV